jgi:antitoxin (DNA-binding transcriptional repressor) of toxin-antitoxin stability system
MPLFDIDDVVAARDAGRGLSGLLQRLRSGEKRRFIIVFRNRPQAVLLHIDEYRELLRRAGDDSLAA